MSTLSVTTVTTGLSTTDLTLNTANTGAGDIIIQSDGLGMVLSGNSSTNTLDLAPNGHIAISNTTVNTFVLTSTGVLTIANTLSASIFSGNTLLVKNTFYTANGTHTKVANLVSMVVYCIGAGSGGGGATGAASATGFSGGAGGVGGSTVIKLLTNTQVGTTSNVVVGIGGAGSGSAAAASTAGSNSSFANSTNGLITAGGGGAVTGAAAGTVGASANYDLLFEGQPGANGSPNGAAYQAQAGAGGASGLSFGQGGGPGRWTGAATGVGRDGKLYGSGGGGGSFGNTAVSQSGGAGANGGVWVIEYYNGV